ncbi:MAG: ABC transporter permease [Sphaerochaetaceae bacterium]
MTTMVDQNGNFSMDTARSAVTSLHFMSSLINSIVMGCIVAVTATMVGFLFAFTITRTNIKFKKFFHTIALLPILSPPFVIALAIIILFGRSGVITRQILGIENNNVYGLTSMVVDQTLALFPLAYLNLRGLLEAIDGSVENASRSLGASRWQVFKSVTFPLTIPGILSSFLIVFAKSISDFGTPQVLGGDYNVLATQAYLQITGLYNLNTGAFMALSILVPAMLAFFIQKYWVARRSFVTVTGKPVGGYILIEEKHITRPLFALCTFVTLIILMFYGTVVWISFVKTWGVNMQFSLTNYIYAFQRGKKPIQDTLILSLICAPITAIFGLIIAYLLVRKEFFGKKLMEFATLIPFAVPGIVLGIGYIFAFNTGPIVLTGTGFIIVVALMFRNLPIGVETGTNSLRQIDPAIEEASTILGANNYKTFTKISLPLMKSALFSGLLNAFVRAMTSISAIIFLISVRWKLLTVSILSEVEQSSFGRACAFCVILMVIVLIAFQVLDLLMNRIDKRSFGRGHIDE